MASDTIVDLRINKSTDDYTPTVGQEVQWTIEVSNDGPGYADNVRVNDLIPEGMSLVSGQVEIGSIDPATGIWSLGGLANGAESTATLTMVVTEDDQSYITNKATVVTDSHDCNPSNDNNPMAVDPWAPIHSDLSLVKTVNDPNPEVGSVVEWVVKVTNDGPDTAWGTIVNDTLPDGVTFVGARASTGNYDFASGQWYVGGLENGDTAELVISTRIDSDAAVEYVNTAVTSSHSIDANPDNNTDDAKIFVTAGAQESLVAEAEEITIEIAVEDVVEEQDCHVVAHCCVCEHQEETGADLQVVKLVSDATPNLNSEVVWSMVVTNNGPEDAVNVLVHDNLPAGVEYVSDVATVGAFDVDSGVWEIGDLAYGESAMLQITSVATDAAAVQTNIALVSSDTEDSNPANNVAVESIDAVNADLAITKTPDELAPDLGEEFDWTIKVENKGPDTAENVIVNDLLPPDTVFVASDDPRFELAADGSNGLIELGDLAAGEEVSFTITAKVMNAEGPRTNTAEVSSTTYDDNPDNNRDDAVVDAVAADLELEKTVIPGEAAPEDVVEWTVTVTNKGPDDATNVQVEDMLPDGVQYLSDTGAAAEFDSETGLWNIGDIAAGTSVTITISALVTDTGRITNVAQVVASDQFDPDSRVDNDDGSQSEDDEDSALLVVPEIIDLALTQEITNAAGEVITVAEVGETVTYIISVSNESTVDATGVVAASQLSDHFQSGVLDFNDSSDTAIVADPASNWNIGDLTAGETVTLTVQATVNSAGEISNVAEIVQADQEDVDSDPANYDSARDPEDDEAVVSITVPDPNPLPVATSEMYEVKSEIEPLNAVIMVDHSGSMGTKSAGHKDSFPATGTDLTGPNGELTSRLQLIRDAVENFAAREQVAAVKVMGFDGSAGGDGNVSPWYEVTGPSPDTSGIKTFVDAFEAGGYTNYGQATIAAQSNLDPIPSLASGTNYYFLTDGNPWAGGRGGPGGAASGAATAGPAATEPEHYTLTDAEELKWQEFADANYNEAYGIGFGGGITNDYGLEQVAHSPGQPDVYGVTDDTNSLLVAEADEIPALLYSLVSDTVSGTVIDAADTFGGDGPAIAGGGITSIMIDGNTYSYSGTDVSVSDGTAPPTTVLRDSSLNAPTEEGGRLEFNFGDGSFVYYAPYAEEMKTEAFEYTITDGSGDSATATLTVEVLPSSIVQPDPVNPDPAVLQLLESDDLFTSGGTDVTQPADGNHDQEWAADSTMYDDYFYDISSVVI